MGRAPCCEKVGLKKGRWTVEEDEILIKYIQANGEGSWRSLPKNAGLLRCGKSCRLRWINYLRTDLKRGNITPEEEETILRLHSTLGNRWSLIAGQLPGRTDNEIKNYWNSHLSRKIQCFNGSDGGESSSQTVTERATGNVEATATQPLPVKRRGSRTSRAATMRKNGSYTLRSLNQLISSYKPTHCQTPTIDGSSASNSNLNHNSNNFGAEVNNDGYFESTMLQAPSLEATLEMDTLSSVISSWEQCENKLENHVSIGLETTSAQELERGESQSSMLVTPNEVSVSMIPCYNDIMIGPNGTNLHGIRSLREDMKEKYATGIDQKHISVSGSEDMDSGMTNVSSYNGGESSDQWFSSSTTSNLEDRRLDWEWDGTGVVDGSVDHQFFGGNDQKDNVLSWLWDSDNIDTGGSNLEPEKQEAMVAWLLS